MRFGGCSCCNHLFNRKHVLIFYIRMIARCLGTIPAILRATAGLDGNQCGKLHRVGIVMLTVNQLRPMNQVAERQIEQSFDAANVPALKISADTGKFVSETVDRSARRRFHVNDTGS